MTTFDERERAFEQMFVHDEEMHFRALARRNSMVGRWAAEQLGLKSNDADAYVRDTLETVLSQDGDDRMLRKIVSDLSPVSSYWTESRLRLVISEFMMKAAAEVRVQAG
jgi:hypothetical protein